MIVVVLIIGRLVLVEGTVVTLVVIVIVVLVMAVVVQGAYWFTADRVTNTAIQSRCKGRVVVYRGMVVVPVANGSSRVCAWGADHSIL